MALVEKQGAPNPQAYKTTKLKNKKKILRLQKEKLQRCSRSVRYQKTGNSSGWITNDEFVYIYAAFYQEPSKESPALLVLDNRSSHLSVPTIDLAKENGVVMLSFPPHCSHKLQPLDVAVYGPFKRYMSSAQDAWMRNNAGKTMTI